jgi:hypothetical protein
MNTAKRCTTPSLLLQYSAAVATLKLTADCCCLRRCSALANASKTNQNDTYTLHNPLWTVGYPFFQNPLKTKQMIRTQSQNTPSKHGILMDDTPKSKTNLLSLLLGGVAFALLTPTTPNTHTNEQTLCSPLLLCLLLLSTHSCPGDEALRSTLFLLNPIFLQVS